MENHISTSTPTRYKIISYEEAQDEVRKIYDDTMKTLHLPFVLNWFKCQGSNATLLRGNWAKLKSTLIEGTVPNVLKQLIIHNVSKERNCEYCAKAHGIFADSMSALVSDEEGYRITKDLHSEILPNSYKVAVQVVTRIALHPYSTSDADFRELEKSGYSSSEIQELMAQADLVNMLNTIAFVSGITIDNELLEIEA